MKPLDKHFLLLQFRLTIHSSNGTKYQSFFEGIMEKAYSDFQKIKPYGNKGDGGNDGYRKKSGIYYQVYAPNTPKVNELKAAKKLQEDFAKLMVKWDGISTIKEYYFVFNDKFSGSTQQLEKTISLLTKENPSIHFELFLAKDLETTFFMLSEAEMLELGFTIDQRQAITNANIYLNNIQIELDRENSNFALKTLDNIKVIIYELNDENLSLDFEFLECRCLQQLERYDEAKEKYKNISARYPDDLRSLLNLAEIYLLDKDFKNNEIYIEKAEIIDTNFWLVKLERILRKIHLGIAIDPIQFDEKTIPEDPKIISHFFRLYGLIYENLGNRIVADSYIEKAIHLNPNKFINYISKLSLIENRLFSTQNSIEMQQYSQELLDEIEKVEIMFSEYGDIGSRNKAILNGYKLMALQAQENISEFENIVKETFNLLLTCYFNIQIDDLLVKVMLFVSIPNNDLLRLLEYLKYSKKEISDNLSGELISQFNFQDNLFTLGKNFFFDIKHLNYYNFICDLENNDHKKVMEFLQNNQKLSIILANTLKSLPDIRKMIIQKLPDGNGYQKDQLLLLLNFEEKNYDEVLQILKQLDLSNLNYLECRQILQIVQHSQTWDFEIIILEKLIEKERNEKENLNLRLLLFDAYFKINKYLEVINLGEQLLLEDAKKNLFSPRNKEAILGNTIIACLERGKIDNETFKKAKDIISQYHLENPSFQYKVGIEAEVYLNNNETENALKSIIEGAKIKKVFSPQEYAKMFFLLSIKINDPKLLNLDSLEVVQENTFIKIKNKDQWYFVGQANELDAILVSESNPKHFILINKRLHETICINNKYGTEIHEEEIEIIYPIEKYIFWQSGHNFKILSEDGDLEGVQVVKIPQNQNIIDPSNLYKFMEDLNKQTEPHFKLYCQNNVPLSMLAISEGGLLNAIGRIQQEKKGYINFCNGTNNDINDQKEIAKKVLDEKKAFFIDGTSALFLSETGTIQKICSFLPNLKIPQSVINFLINSSDRFRYSAGQIGHMGYYNGGIVLSSIDKEKRDFIQSNFITSIKKFESNPQNICIISDVNKINCFSEKSIPDELCDACVLAQKENLPVLTEDFLYLKYNEFETKKNAPKYFSSLILVRVLYEKGLISFKEYLEYFSYLSSYRFRLLPVSIDDIDKAVFGDGKIKHITTENIKMLNFPLTLSEEYGVPFTTAFNIVTMFLLKVLLDSSVTPETVDKIFIEIIDSFPTKIKKRDFGQMLLQACSKYIFNINSPLIINIHTTNQLINTKIDHLYLLTNIYNSKLNNIDSK
jgi:hypothetical protein